jgi:hypothetical protein
MLVAVLLICQSSRNPKIVSGRRRRKFGPKPPRLVDYLKGVLNSYPDGAQILKV